LGEALGMPIITVARAVELIQSDPVTVRVTRVTPNGDELVEAACPAVVTISNELGTPRYPVTARTMKARRMKPTVLSVEQLGLQPQDIRPLVTLTRQFVSTVQGHCEFITGNDPAELAQGLVARLREARLLN
jgi:electron transfer flavoprotein beta subunit